MFLTTGGYIFGLDMQLLSGMVFQIIAILLLFLALSYLLFDPVRTMLNDRKERVASDVRSAKEDRQKADEYKLEYEAKLKNIEKDADIILSEARKKALAKENEMIAEAKEEAAGMIAHANKEAELEMKKAKDEIKQQMIEVATLMAGKMIEVSLEDEDHAKLLQETLEEMGEDTWLS